MKDPSMSNHTRPTPVAVAHDVVIERELYAFVLSVLEDRCSSFALDDATDRERCAQELATHLAHRGGAVVTAPKLTGAQRALGMEHRNKPCTPAMRALLEQVGQGRMLASEFRLVRGYRSLTGYVYLAEGGRIALTDAGRAALRVT